MGRNCKNCGRVDCRVWDTCVANNYSLFVKKEEQKDIIWFGDIETGGAEYYDGTCEPYGSKYSILSVAFIAWCNGVQLDKYEAFVKEDPIVISTEAMCINKIDLRDETIEWKSPKTVVEELCNIIPANSILGGKNPAFDNGFLKRLFRLGGQTKHYPFSYRMLDVSSVAKAAADAGKIKPKSFGLKNLCDYFDIKMENYHTALADVLITIQVYEKLLEVLKGNNVLSNKRKNSI